METKCSVSIIPGLFSNAVYQVHIYEDGFYNMKQFSNYDKALNWYNERKAQGYFDSLELVVIGTIDEVVNNGNDDE